MFEISGNRNLVRRCGRSPLATRMPTTERVINPDFFNVSKGKGGRVSHIR